MWQLTADLDINSLENMSLGYGEDWALFQNGENIRFEDLDYLVWN